LADDYTTGDAPVLVVRAGGNLLAVSMKSVAATGVVDRVVPVPGSQSGIIGVTYFDDSIEAVLELTSLIRNREQSHNRRMEGVKIESGGLAAVLLVDEILGEEKVQGAGDDGKSAPDVQPWTAGVVKTGRGVLPLLNAEAVLKQRGM